LVGPTVSFPARVGRGERRLLLVVALFVAVAVVVAVVEVGSHPDGHLIRPDPNVIARHGMEAPPRTVGTTTTGPDQRLLPLLPTSASPLRILEIGDSLGIDLGDQLRDQIDSGGLAHTIVASVGDSGLSNITYFDWPAQLAAMLAADHAQVVVVFIGANDDQGIELGGVAAAPGTLAWTLGYRQRVDDILRVATTSGARVVWVGMPPMLNAGLNRAVQSQDLIYEREAEAFPGALYVSSDPVLGNAAGLYEPTGEDASGHLVVLRTADGVHLTPTGAGVLARTVIGAIDNVWRLSL
jgi:hypothetical protein